MGVHRPPAIRARSPAHIRFDDRDTFEPRLCISVPSSDGTYCGESYTDSLGEQTLCVYALSVYPVVVYPATEYLVPPCAFIPSALRVVYPVMCGGMCCRRTFAGTSYGNGSGWNDGESEGLFGECGIVLDTFGL